MNLLRISLAAGCLALLSLPLIAEETTTVVSTRSQADACITPPPFGGTGQLLPHYPGTDCTDPNCTQCVPPRKTWWTKLRDGWGEKSRGFRRWWYRENQSKKGLQHPTMAPLHQPNWGYHPTCWRRFPPICNTCPSAGGTFQAAPPGPYTPTPIPAAIGNDVTRRQTADEVLPVFSLNKNWQATGQGRTAAK